MLNIWDKLKISFSEPVRDPIWHNILLPSSFSELVLSKDFIKLSRILQLGPAQLVYPGATHTRRAHSFGVFEIAKRILSTIASKADSGSIIHSINKTEALSFLVAALCHDLGHFPYTHSLKELPLREHEELTADIMLGPLAEAIRKAGASPELAAAIVDENLAVQGQRAPDVPSLFRGMLSGVLDPDKLDYLNRDAWACGVPYGTQDVDFMLQHIALNDSGRLAISERGIMSVEALLFSKYQMYKAVYWHKNVRAATAMIKHALIEAMHKGDIFPGDLYGLDDHGFYELMTHKDESMLISSVFSGRLCALCYDIMYDKNNSMHKKAADLANRAELEKQIEANAKIKGVIIDLPEPISFESDLPILETNNSFQNSSTVFSPGLVASFSASLRVLRVYCIDEYNTNNAGARIYGIAKEMFGK